MSLSKPYADIPGTTVFDTDQARRGYHLNMFCMSLMKPENRASRQTSGLISRSGP
jgi:protocatechuate 4,5-dioxygenase alpha subunit